MTSQSAERILVSTESGISAFPASLEIIDGSNTLIIAQDQQLLLCLLPTLDTECVELEAAAGV